MSHWNDNLPAQELDLLVLFTTLQIRKASISTILTDSDISTTKQLRDQTYTALKEFQIPKHPTCVKLVLSNSARRFGSLLGFLPTPCQPEAEVVLPLGGLGLARRWLKAQQASLNLKAEFERTCLTQVGCLGIWNSFRAV